MEMFDVYLKRTLNIIVAAITTIHKNNVSNIEVAASSSTEPFTKRSQRIADITWLFGVTRNIIELSSLNVRTKMYIQADIRAGFSKGSIIFRTV